MIYLTDFYVDLKRVGIYALPMCNFIIVVWFSFSLIYMDDFFKRIFYIK